MMKPNKKDLPSLSRPSTPPTRTASPNPISPLSPISPWPPQLPSTSHKSASTTPNNTPTREESGAEVLPSAKEIYGFIAALGTYLLFGIYLIWAFCPPRWLDSIGWTWYPDREWAIIIPCYLMVIMLLAYWSYAALTAYNTPSFDNLTLITDTYANIPEKVDGKPPYYWDFADPKAVPVAVDLPIDLVHRVLYETDVEND